MAAGPVIRMILTVTMEAMDAPTPHTMTTTVDIRIRRKVIGTRTVRAIGMEHEPTRIAIAIKPAILSGI